MGGACVCVCVQSEWVSRRETGRGRETRLATEADAWVAYERTAWTARRVNMLGVQNCCASDCRLGRDEGAASLGRTVVVALNRNSLARIALKAGLGAQNLSARRTRIPRAQAAH